MHPIAVYGAATPVGAKNSTREVSMRSRPSAKIMSFFRICPSGVMVERVWGKSVWVRWRMSSIVSPRSLGWGIPLFCKRTGWICPVRKSPRSFNSTSKLARLNSQKAIAYSSSVFSNSTLSDSACAGFSASGILSLRFQAIALRINLPFPVQFS